MTTVAAIIWLFVILGLSYLALRSLFRLVRNRFFAKASPTLPEMIAADETTTTDDTPFQREEPPEGAEWVVVCNMEDATRHRRDGTSVRGSNAFAPGTKLYLGHIYGGMAQTAHFIGINRKTRKYTNCAIRIAYVVDARVKAEYSPRMRRYLDAHNAQTFHTRDDAVEAAEYLSHIYNLENDLLEYDPDTKVPQAKPGANIQGAYPMKWH